jgi:hypothetical protein
MKNLIYYILIIPALTALSCTKLLDVQPAQSISDEQAITDREGIEKAVTGAYYSLHEVGNYARNRILIDDLAADNLDWSGTTREYQQVDQNLIAADNGIMEGMWASNYDCINRVNNVLDRIGGIDMTEADRNLFTGDALFLRALSHFNLLSYFGAIPLKTRPTTDLSNIDQARNSVAEVYTQIVQDLLLAETLLPETRTAGWASSYSATALLARVYLSQFHFTNDPAIAALAIEKAGKVIGDGRYTLAETYEELFAGNTTEPIFEVIFNAQNFNRQAQYFFPVSLTGRGEVSPNAAFVTEFQALGDDRFASSVAFDPSNKPYGNKYRDIVSGTDRVIVLRLAEMHLIRAEALAYTDGDITLIKSDLLAVRSRAGLGPVAPATIPELKLAIENERRYEFAFEGHRWSDLVRTKRAAQVLGIDEKFTLFPIPLSEMQTNKLMEQNPGY